MWSGFCSAKLPSFEIGSRPDGRGTFLWPPKKSAQKKGGPQWLARTFNYKAATQPCPALLAKPGARATRDLADARFAQTGRELLPGFTAMLGCARRVGEIQNQHPDPSTTTRLHSPSTAATPGSRCAPCLSESSAARSRVVRAPGMARNAGNRRSR